MAKPVWVSFILSLVLYRYGIFLYTIVDIAYS